MTDDIDKVRARWAAATPEAAIAHAPADVAALLAEIDRLRAIEAAAQSGRVARAMAAWPDRGAPRLLDISDDELHARVSDLATIAAAAEEYISALDGYPLSDAAASLQRLRDLLGQR